ncbi:MAG TPA: hypothetical protein RMG48_13740 [Myxococcales bacterium LLY-WYZ-16_1]|jgi:hypothetical protein|nr:hypothetical protein [Myxococcales bacterium LLY-WYZ-16_1]
MTISQVLRICLTFGAAGAVLALSTVASAQERRAPRRVIRLEETRIEGRIQKPQAFYILQRSNLNFEGLELKNSFIPKIIESVEDEPF